jgi:repressor LexA
MNIVRELRKKKGIQQKELALTLGVSQPTISDWEANKKDPSGDRLKRLADYFGVDELVILGKGVVDLNSPTQQLDDFIALGRSVLPIIGDIACGEPILAEQNIEGYADLPEGVHADFALRCKGDSMTPTFLNGDLVLIRRQPEVENGQIAAVSIGGEATLKHVYMRESGLMLVADNPSYEPILAVPESDRQIIIHGLAVGYIRIF